MTVWHEVLRSRVRLLLLPAVATTAMLLLRATWVAARPTPPALPQYAINTIWMVTSNHAQLWHMQVHWGLAYYAPFMHEHLVRTATWTSVTRISQGMWVLVGTTQIVSGLSKHLLISGSQHTHAHRANCCLNKINNDSSMNNSTTTTVSVIQQ